MLGKALACVQRRLVADDEPGFKVSLDVKDGIAIESVINQFGFHQEHIPIRERFTLQHIPVKSKITSKENYVTTAVPQLSIFGAH